MFYFALPFACRVLAVAKDASASRRDLKYLVCGEDSDLTGNFLLEVQSPLRLFFRGSKVLQQGCIQHSAAENTRMHPSVITAFLSCCTLS